MTPDFAALRSDFPILDREVNGRRLVYLDSAATSQKPRQVIDAMSDYYERYNANVHRGVYSLAEQATAAFEGARMKVAQFVGAPDPMGCVFTKNCTEAINLVAYAWARRRLKPGDEILVTEMEHHSNLVPWHMTAQDTGAVVKFIGVTDGGELDLAQLDGLLTDRTKLVAVTAMSNVLGVLNDVSRIAEAAHAVGALVLADVAQLVAHAPCDFTSLGCDFMAFSGHKMLGPTGIGVLVARRELLDDMNPFLGGGEMIRDVTMEGATYTDVPWKFEAGTPVIAEAIGLGAAVDYLSAIGMDAVRDHETELVRYGLKALDSIDDLVVYGPKDPERRGSALSFNVFDSSGELLHPHDLGTMLDQHGVAIRAGHHCARPLMRRYDVPAMCRASCYVYNSEADLDALVEAIDKTKRFFAGA
ncbi:MAG TPA: cysteine desulfurase [Actinomycetota bacterium]|nr:cysteine desulfurase [Actinomycetota bacterium]